MVNAKSKKQLILDYRQAHGLDQVAEHEIEAIQADLRRQLGVGQNTSASYIANVLRGAGVRVEFTDPYARPHMAGPYASRLDGLLKFRTLENAESSLRKLDEAYREYQSTADRVGTNLVRSIAIQGKQRARSITRNPHVGPEKRREKEEIAQWFKLWLELPDAFFDWLDLRKRSEEFQKMFPDGKTGTNSVHGE